MCAINMVFILKKSVSAIIKRYNYLFNLYAHIRFQQCYVKKYLPTYCIIYYYF